MAPPAPITLSIDVEDHLGAYAPDGRWAANTRRILDFCAEKNIRATFFAVGQVAGAAPQLLKDIVAGRHELALHSHRHTRLDAEAPAPYARALGVAKKQFEDLTGAPVRGFRAPQFSLTPASIWAVEVLKQEGFLYSSSVLPGRGAFSGFAGAPRTPFLWPCGLIEIPVPVLALGPAALPFLGGVYLRLLPLPLVQALAAHGPAQALLWTYTHPYDIDGQEGFVRLRDGTPLWANMLLMLGRGSFLSRLERLLMRVPAAPLAERATALEGLPVFRP